MMLLILAANAECSRWRSNSKEHPTPACASFVMMLHETVLPASHFATEILKEARRRPYGRNAPDLLAGVALLDRLRQHGLLASAVPHPTGMHALCGVKKVGRIIPAHHHRPPVGQAIRVLRQAHKGHADEGGEHGSKLPIREGHFAEEDRQAMAVNMYVEAL
mmetsp:Transcript_7947/g.12768  ORF Transcript_7947/g.12768 Transcript_7947/m.12768 type:complete len:162 (+) Transcript_7947:81-566(+)